MAAKVLKVEVLETPKVTNGYHWKVGEVGATDLVQYLCGPGAPTNAKVGDRGELHYTATASRGFWAWKAI